MQGMLCLHAALLGSLLVVVGSGPSRALPAATPVTPELVQAAEKEGAVNFYTSVDVEVAEKVKKAFEAKYPRIKVAVERNGAQRQFQRLAQEYASRIFNADVVNSADAAHFVVWKRQGWLAAFVPEDVATPLRLRARRSRRAVRDMEGLALRRRLQHEIRDAVRSAEILCRPPRPEMARAHREGASLL